jgi:hypothetical protein
MRTAATAAVVAVLCCAACAWGEPMTRRPVPAAGEHPRILFDAGYLPVLRQRINGGGHAVVVREQLAAARRDLPRWRAFADLDLGSPTPEQIAEYFKPDEVRNVRWGQLALDAVVREDVEQQRVMAGVLANYARLLLASKKLGEGGAVTERTGLGLNKTLDVWKTTDYGVTTAWLFGGAGYSLAYDLLHPVMSAEQRKVVRQALAAATTGRRPFGAGNPKGRAFSNHYGYHGDLLMMLAAIEGEEGFDKATWDAMRQIMLDYWEVGFTPEGFCHEDSYGPNLGMRAGSWGLMVLARRGDDIFRTEKFRNYSRWVAQETQPFRGGTLVGGASGVGLQYTGSIAVMKHLLPDEPSAAYVYRYFFGDDYRRMHPIQTQLEFAVYGSDHSGADARMGELPLDLFSPRRGKLIARSAWGDGALAIHLDARPDAFAIGHDAPERGSISILGGGGGGGRAWSHVPNFRETEVSTDFSIVHIDGKGQGYKAPSARFVGHGSGAIGAAGLVDLKYAYDWQWTPDWPKLGQKFPAPWEPEPNDPRALGWPDDPDWLPHRLHDEPGTGYIGSNLWRRPSNPVERAYRAMALVRGERPFAVVVDDIRKGGGTHKYDWYLQLAGDVVLDKVDGRDIWLKEQDGERRLLIRAVSAEGLEGARVERYEMRKDPRSGAVTPGNRLIVSATAVEPKFLFVVMPIAPGETAPETAAEGMAVVVKAGGQTTRVSYTAGDKPGLAIERDGARVEAK